MSEEPTELETAESSQDLIHYEDNPQELMKPGSTPAQARIDAVASLLHEAYKKASLMELTQEEITALTADFPDEAFRTGASGNPNLIYIEHAHLRDRLNQVIGVGQWALIVRNRWAEEYLTQKKESATRVYVEAVLLVRGCFAAEAIGDMTYFKNNPTQCFGDAVEGAKSAALRRCAKELGIGLQAWKKEYGDGWHLRQREKAAGRRSEAKGASTVPPGPKTPGNAPSGPANGNPEDRKVRFLAMFAGLEDYAKDEFIERDWILPTEDLADIHVDQVPKTLKAVQAVVSAVKARAGVVDEPPVTSGNDPKPDLTGCETITGVIEQVSTKNGQSAKGPWQRVGIRIGETWFNSFSATIANQAEALKNQEVELFYRAGKLGNDIVAIHRVSDLTP